MHSELTELWRIREQLDEIQKDLSDIKAQLRQAGLWSSGPQVPDFLKRREDKRRR